MHCTNCGTVVPDGAAFCPKCGQAQAPATTQQSASPPKKSGRKLLGCLGIAVAIVVALAIIGSLAPKQSGTGSSKGATGEETSGGELPIAVTATELFNAYQNNEATAQSYFGDRKLLVSGTVEKVMLDLMDDPVVLLRTPNQFMSAQAALADDAKDEAGNFNPGDKAKLLCEGVSEIASMPMLKECRTAPAGLKGQPVRWAD
jgi:hypothetical protein